MITLFVFLSNPFSNSPSPSQTRSISRSAQQKLMNSLTEVATSERYTHDFTSIFEGNFTELGNPAFSGSFVKKTLMKNQPLRKGGHVMRIDIHHAEPIAGGFGLRIRDTEREDKTRDEQKWAHEIQLRIAKL